MNQAADLPEALRPKPRGEPNSDERQWSNGYNAALSATHAAEMYDLLESIFEANPEWEEELPEWHGRTKAVLAKVGGA